MRVPIGDLFDEIQRPAKMQDSTEYDLVTVKRSRGGIVRRSTLQGHKISVKSQFELRADDFLISKRQIVHGACAVVDEEFSGSIVSNEYSVLRCRDELNLPFLKYMTHTPYFQRTCFHSSIGVHVEKMIFKLDDWFQWNIDIPSLPEQKKIAAFLGAVDGKLAGLRRKEAALVRYKNGLMQQLFSGTRRFTKPDGTPYPDWEEKRLGDVFDITSSKRVFQSEWQDQGVPFYRAREVIKLATDGNVDNELFISEDMYTGYSEKYGAPIADDILVTGVGTIGKVYLVKPEDRFYFKDGNIIWLRSNKSISSEFVVHLFRSEIVQRQILIGAAITTVATYTIDSAKKTRIPIPHPEEQQKIADALSALDTKISAVSDQITRLDAFKKGLLQQMFV